MRCIGVEQYGLGLMGIYAVHGLCEGSALSLHPATEWMGMFTGGGGSPSGWDWGPAGSWKAIGWEGKIKAAVAADGLTSSEKHCIGCHKNAWTWPDFPWKALSFDGHKNGLKCPHRLKLQSLAWLVITPPSLPPPDVKVCQ